MISLEGTNSKRSPWRRLCLATSPLPPDSTLSNSSFCFAKPSVLSHSFSNVPFSRDRGSQPQSTPVLFLIPSHSQSTSSSSSSPSSQSSWTTTTTANSTPKEKESPPHYSRHSQHYSKRWETTEILPAPILPTRRKWNSAFWKMKKWRERPSLWIANECRNFLGTCHDALFAAAVVARRRKFQSPNELWSGGEWRSMDAA